MTRVAKVHFWEPTPIGRCMLVDVPEGPLRTDAGAQVDLARVTPRVVEAIFQKPEDAVEVELLQGEPDRAVELIPTQAPRFTLATSHLGYQEFVFRPVQRETIYRGMLRTREVAQGPFRGSDGEVGMLHVVRDCVFPGVEIFEVSFGNTRRCAEDVTGSEVDGELNFTRFAVELPSRSHVAVFQDDTPYQYRDELEYVLADSRVLTKRRRFRLRFGFAPSQLEEVLRTMLAFQDWGTVVDGHGYMDRGGYGPLEEHLMDLSSGFSYRGNEGWEAVRHMSRDDLFERQHLKEQSPYLLPTLGTKEGNDPGGFGIKPHMGHLQVPEWHHRRMLDSELWGNRHSWMFDPCGEPLDIFEVADLNFGEQPWLVKRTNRSENREGTSIPWKSDVGHPWNVGSSPEETWQRSHADVDHAHSVRLFGPLIDNVWGVNSELSKIELRALVAHYQYDPTLFRDDGNSVPRLMTATENWGDGALGRQIGWPMYGFAAAWWVSGSHWKRKHVAWRDQLCAAVWWLTSPAGGNRKRLYPHWGWASPKPLFGAGEVADQVFEMCYVALGARALEMTGSEDAGLIFEAIGKGLNGELGDPIWRKFISYAHQAAGLYDKPKDDSGGGAGDPHQGNLCGLLWRGLRDDKYLGRAKEWLMMDSSGSAAKIDDSNYVRWLLEMSGGWDGAEGHEMTDFWWHASTAAAVQQRLRGEDAELEDDGTADDDGRPTA